MRLVEDNPASLSLLDVFKISCSKRQIEFDAAIGRYYEKIASTQLTGNTVSDSLFIYRYWSLNQSIIISFLYRDEVDK